eukprot:scaffold2237_cov175-Ochromonas_danica.AAC.28
MPSAACHFCSLPDDSIQNGSNTALSNFFTGSTILGSASLYLDHVSIPQSPLHGPTMTMHAVRGNCPLCESPMSASMLALIQNYWEAFKTQVEDEAGGKSSAIIELEELSPLIPNFIKRFRSVYEQGENMDVVVDNMESVIGMGGIGMGGVSGVSGGVSGVSGGVGIGKGIGNKGRQQQSTNDIITTTTTNNNTTSGIGVGGVGGTSSDIITQTKTTLTSD